MYNARVYHVMIGAPSDIKEEVDIVKEVLHKWNGLNTKKEKVVLLPIFWADNTYPATGDRTQGIINKQIVEDSDLLICVFGARVGAPTGEAISGSIEEINEHMKAGKPVMVFFKRSGSYDIDIEQLKKVKEFRESIKDRVLWVDYDKIEQFKETLSAKLQLFLNDNWLKKSEENKWGDISPRLKDLLSKLTNKDIERVKKICPYVVFFDNHPKLLQSPRDPYDLKETSFLEELGILNPEKI